MLFCSICTYPLDHPDAVRSHNVSGCAYLREPEAPHQICKVLPTKRFPRWEVLAMREERDERRREVVGY